VLLAALAARGAILLALIALIFQLERPRTRLIVLLAALPIAVSGAIGVFHAGVEMGWWEGITAAPPSARPACRTSERAAGPLRPGPMAFLGLSLAGWNAICLVGGAA
jgi:disulfide bond formation protein DsbB